MKAIRNLLYTLLLIFFILFVYMNIDAISSFFVSFLGIEKKPEISESNEYTRDYNYVRFSKNDNYTPYTKGNIENIYFNVLNNGWDEFTFYCPKEYEDCIKEVSALANDKTRISRINNYISPFNSYIKLDTEISNNYEVKIIIKRNYTTSEIIELNEKINEISKLLDLGNKTDHEIIKQVHDYIIENTLYDNTFSEENGIKQIVNTAVGPLLYGEAICSGYTDAFSLFMDKYNIPNLKISNSEHVWNLVYIDSKWLHIDLTWDDDESNSRNRENYYLIDTDTLKELDESHSFDEVFFVESKNLN